MNHGAITAVVIASLLVPTQLLAQGTGTKSAPEATSTNQTHTGIGVVKKVDPAANTVRLAHDPIKTINWPSMTMNFKVKDRALLDKLVVDKKVEFDFVKEGNSYIIVAVR
jgi:Cu(I)/Ag(I) efflux system protein CusF